MHTIYIFVNRRDGEDLIVVAVGDDGVEIGSHMCSSEYFIPHDMGITSSWKRDRYDEHFGVGNWKLEYVAKPAKHTELQRILCPQT